MIPVDMKAELLLDTVEMKAKLLFGLREVFNKHQYQLGIGHPRLFRSILNRTHQYSHPGILGLPTSFSFLPPVC